MKGPVAVHGESSARRSHQPRRWHVVDDDAANHEVLHRSSLAADRRPAARHPLEAAWAIAALAPLGMTSRESATTNASTSSGARQTISWATLPPRLSPTSATGAARNRCSNAMTSQTAASNSNRPSHRRQAVTAQIYRHGPIALTQNIDLKVPRLMVERRSVQNTTVGALAALHPVLDTRVRSLELVLFHHVVHSLSRAVPFAETTRPGNYPKRLLGA